MDADSIDDEERAVELIKRHVDADETDAALAAIDRLLASLASAPPGPATDVSVARALLWRAFVLEERAAARACVLAAVDRLGEQRADDEGHALYLHARYEQARFAFEDGDVEAAGRVLDRLLSRWRDAPSEEALETIVDARYLRASVMDALGDRVGALAAYDQIARDFALDELTTDANVTVANALLRRAFMLRGESDHHSAIATLADLVNRLEHATEPELRELAVGALCVCGTSLEALGVPEEAVKLYTLVVDQYGDDEDAETARQVAWAREVLEELT